MTRWIVPRCCPRPMITYLVIIASGQRLGGFLPSLVDSWWIFSEHFPPTQIPHLRCFLCFWWIWWIFFAVPLGYFHNEVGGSFPATDTFFAVFIFCSQSENKIHQIHQDTIKACIYAVLFGGFLQKFFHQVSTKNYNFSTKTANEHKGAKENSPELLSRELHQSPCDY